MSENLSAQIFTPAQLQKLSDWQALNEFLGIPEPARGHEAPTSQIKKDVSEIKNSIVITEEMKHAGANALANLDRHFFDDLSIAEAVFLAMETSRNVSTIGKGEADSAAEISRGLGGTE